MRGWPSEGTGVRIGPRAADNWMSNPPDRHAPMPSKHRPLWLAGLLLLLTALVFSDLPSQRFLSWDDGGTIAENPYLNPPSVGHALYFWSHPHMDLYIPVTYTVWSVVAAVARLPHPQAGAPALAPGAFKAANVLLHLLSVLVLFALLRRLVRSDWGAFAGALIFAIHPVQVEPVAWISGLKDVLCGLLSLVALWQYTAFAERAREGDSDGRRWIHYGAAAAAFALALMSKPVAMAVPAAAGALDLWAVRRPLREVARSLAPWLALALPWMAVTRHFQPAPGVGDQHPLWTRPLIAGDALSFYLWHTLLPLRLGPDYGRNPEWVLRHAWGYWSWLLPAAVGALLWWGRKRRPVLVAAAGLAVCPVLPVLGLVPFDFQHFSTVSDHYLYVAMAGPALALAWFFSTPRPRAAVFAFSAAAAALAGISILQTYHWANNRALFAHTVAVNPRSWMGYCSLGMALDGEGDRAGALRALRNAVRCNPDDLKSHRALADVLDTTGQPWAAVAQYREALRCEPGNAKVHVNLGVVLDRLGGAAAAEREFAEAARLRPELWEAHFNLGNMRARRGDLPGAAAAYREAARRNPEAREPRLKLAQLTRNPE